MNSSANSLKEGETYLFQVGKKVLLPDETEVLILKGPDNRRFMLDAQRYRWYGLETGKEAECRVDRINCKGEVFLEPRHPVYREMVRYPFRVKDYQEIEGSRIREGKVLAVEDHFGNEILLPVPSVAVIPPPGSAIELLVLSIKKGRVQLALDKNDKRTAHLSQNKSYNFEVAGTEFDYDGEEYFVVTDQFGVAHPVKKRYYEHYGLKKGKQFTGKVVKYREDGSVIIEPDNPFYKPGQFVEIAIKRNERNRTDDSWYIMGEDRFGHSHELRLAEKIEGNSLLCRVEMIRKGKPLLVPLPDNRVGWE